MADNVTLNSGSGGATLATDDVSDVHYQEVKLVDGTKEGTTPVASGGGVEANALRVTVASDSTGVLSIDDNGGSITVDGTVTANLSATDNAVLDNIQTAVELIDNAISGSEMQVDIVSGNVTNAGTFAVQVDGDALTALQLIDDAIYADDADWTDGTSKHMLVGGLYQSSPQTVTDGDVAPLNLTVNGAAHVSVQDALPAGTNAIGKLAANSGVDIGDVDILSIVPGTGATNLGKAEDTTHTTGDVGVMALSVRNDTLAALAGTDGDYAPLQVNASGALFIQEGAAMDVSAATVTVDLGANNDVTIDNSSIVHAEDATHNTGDAGIMPLAVRNDDLAALAGTDGDYAPLQVNAEGALFVAQGPSASGGISTVFRDEDLDETAVVVKASAGMVYWIHCINFDATPIYVHLYDVAQGSVTVGTTGELCSFAVPSQGDANGAGFTMHFDHGIEFGTAITAAATTTIGGTAGPDTNECIINIGYK